MEAVTRAVTGTSSARNFPASGGWPVAVIPAGWDGGWRLAAMTAEGRDAILRGDDRGDDKDGRTQGGGV
jgi:hypothetical protein